LLLRSSFFFSFLVFDFTFHAWFDRKGEKKKKEAYAKKTGINLELVASDSSVQKKDVLPILFLFV